MATDKQPKIVVIGGGTGSFTLLNGLKNYTPEVTALVNMADDGGSTGILRDELGVLPPGDIRQCLVALSNTSKLRDLFNFRFDSGSLQGHSFGNLFLSAVEKMTDNFTEAVELASEILHITGQVIPITTQKAELTMRDTAGNTTKKQYAIGNMDFGEYRRPVISLDPPCQLYSQADIAIKQADIVVIAPGNLYGSLAPALVVNGVADALANTNAKVIYVCNLVTKPRQTDGFMVHDYASEIERFIGKPVLDYVIYNNEQPPREALKKYARDDEFLVNADTEQLAKAHYQAQGLALIADEPAQYSENDQIASSRSLIRHDSEALVHKLDMILSKHR